MAAVEQHQILVGTPITTHSFNESRQEVAIVPNSNHLQIYQKQESSSLFTLKHTLTDHDKLITCVDWAPKTNRIVTCSQDRNAYVWYLENGVWVPTLVLLRINRAATYVRWSPKEDKFAVASGARLISVCYFEEENNWWVSKHLKKPIRSTVLTVDWHPENILLAAGSSDMKARVFSAWIKGIDAKASNPVWGEKLPFGTVCAEFSAGGWVHDVSFSPSGNQLVYVSHDSSITIASGPTQPLQIIYTSYLPFTTCFWAGESAIVVAGHDCAPFIVSQQHRDAKWELKGKIDTGKKKESITNSAFNKFKQMDSRAQQSGTTESSIELTTTHQNTITTARVYSGDRDRVTRFSTTGVDGKLVIWDLLNASIAGLQL